MARTRCFGLATCCFTLMAIGLFAQTNVGSIFGHVSDQSSGAIRGAAVILLNPATNEKISVTTNENGDYIFNSVRPATYSLSAAITGFKTAVREGIILQVAEKISVRFHSNAGRRPAKDRSAGRGSPFAAREFRHRHGHKHAYDSGSPARGPQRVPVGSPGTGNHAQRELWIPQWRV